MTKGDLMDKSVRQVVIEYLQASLDDLGAHHKKCGGGPSRVEVRSALRGTTAYLEIWWLDTDSSVMTDMMWDRLEVDGAIPADLENLPIPYIGMPVKFTKLNVLPRPSTKTVEPPLYAYHPQRVHDLLPFGKELAWIGQSAPVEYVGTIEPNQVEMLAEILLDAQMPSPDTPVPIRQRVAVSDASMKLRVAIEGYLSFVWWERAGRNIFDMPAQLTDMFRHTDIDDVPAEMLKLPYSSFYLAFGPQVDLELEPGWHPDGAYVSTTPNGDLKICVTARAPDVDTFRATQVRFEPFFIKNIRSQYLKMSLGEAVSMALSDQMAQLRKEMEDVELEKVGSEASSVLIEEAGVGVRSIHRKRAERELENLPAAHDVFEQMLRLVANAMVYLTAYPDDVKTDWPAATPARLRKQAISSERPTQARNAKSKLLALGYTAIHFCGHGLQFAPHISPGKTDGMDIEAPTYRWVRGFWVRQAYGPRHSLRKLQWRMPFRRRVASAGGDSDVGHVYLVT